MAYRRIGKTYQLKQGECKYAVHVLILKHGLCTDVGRVPSPATCIQCSFQCQIPLSFLEVVLYLPPNLRPRSEIHRTVRRKYLEVMKNALHQAFDCVCEGDGLYGLCTAAYKRGIGIGNDALQNVLDINRFVTATLKHPG